MSGVTTPGSSSHPPTTCHVCGEAVDAANSAVCHTCGNRFHLRLRNDVEGKDCGQVWINEQFLSLEFACFTCLGMRDSPDVGDEQPVGKGH